MITSTQPNLLLEALAYLGRMANGNTCQHMEHRIRLRKIKSSAAFNHTFGLLKELSTDLEKVIPDDGNLMELFVNLEGFPHNTIGSSSIAFLLFYPMLEQFDKDPESLLAFTDQMSIDRAAYHIACTLNLTSETVIPDHFRESDLIDLLLPLSIPDKSKLAILRTCHDYPTLARQVYGLLSPVICFLKTEQERLLALSEAFIQLVEKTGIRPYLKETSHFNFSDQLHYVIRPFLFGMDTILTSENSSDHLNVYCGILRQELLFMLNEMGNSYDDVFEAYHLLGDRTRFDILCYLCSHDAYGLELSEHFSLSRNTIHHHMNKLVSNGLVSSRNDGNRTYYTLDKAAFALLIRHQEELFGLSHSERNHLISDGDSSI